MDGTDLKGRLGVRLANLSHRLREARQRETLIEADLVRARREAASLAGAVDATQEALNDLETAMHAPGTPPAPTLPNSGV